MGRVTGGERLAKVRSILIVDDSAKCIELMSLALNAAGGAEVRTEMDSGVAVARIGNEELDLVLLDVKMPGMNGFQVLEAVRGAGGITPIVMCSGSVRQTDVNQAFENGCNGYFEKPDSLDSYRKLARSLMDYWSQGDVPTRQ